VAFHSACGGTVWLLQSRVTQLITNSHSFLTAAVVIETNHESHAIFGRGYIYINEDTDDAHSAGPQHSIPNYSTPLLYTIKRVYTSTTYMHVESIKPPARNHITLHHPSLQGGRLHAHYPHAYPEQSDTPGWTWRPRATSPRRPCQCPDRSRTTSHRLLGQQF
jgi:hypothetical protein